MTLRWHRPVDGHEVVRSFPAAAREALMHVLDTQAVVEPETVETLTATLQRSPDAVLADLVGVARAYAVTPMSSFPVGAVAVGMPRRSGGLSRLYLGANLEFAGQSPTLTVHAEQAAVLNAWHHGETALRALAVSAAPCGYCRQFLHELAGADALEILIPRERGTVRRPLAHFLPEPFDPGQLGHAASLMASEPEPLALEAGSGGDAGPLLMHALEAARRSYAPYTHGHAGAALELRDGTMVAGRYAENAAYNPALLPMTAAAVLLNLTRPLSSEPTIVRAALVERASAAGQRAAATAVLSALAPDVPLEYAQVAASEP